MEFVSIHVALMIIKLLCFLLYPLETKRKSMPKSVMSRLGVKQNQKPQYYNRGPFNAFKAFNAGRLLRRWRRSAPKHINVETNQKMMKRLSRFKDHL